MTGGEDWASFEADALRVPDARRERPPQTSVEYQAGSMAVVSIPLAEVPADEAKWRQEIERVTGLPVPSDKRVELAQVRFWGDPDKPNVYCRFLIEARDGAGSAVDAVALLAELRGQRKRFKTVKPLSGPGAFVLSLNDLQLGKREGGGSAATIERVHQAVIAARHRVEELRRCGRPLGRLVLIGGGDLIEGCVVYGNQAFEIDADRRQQIRNCVALILWTLDSLAPLFREVTVLAVGGNHGEHRIGGKKTTRHDNDDCAVFEHAALAAARDDRLGHVKFHIAQDEPAKTLDVCGHILGTTHGHVFGRGAGGPAAKAHKWFAGQAAGRQPIGDADIFISHHYHHFAAQEWGHTLWLQTPAMDGGSPFFADISGFHARPGMMTFVMSETSRFQDLAIL